MADQPLRPIRCFLEEPLQELYEQGFFEVAPGELRIRLRVREGRVEMVAYSEDPRHLNEVVLPFSVEEVFAELCG